MEGSGYERKDVPVETRYLDFARYDNVDREVGCAPHTLPSVNWKTYSVCYAHPTGWKGLLTWEHNPPKTDSGRNGNWA